MPPSFEATTVRQHSRHECSLPARVAIAASCADIVRLSRSAGGDATGLPATVIDVSDAGLGIASKVFLPIGCTLNITIFIGDGRPPIAIVATVARTIMVDRTPMYHLGTLVESIDDDDIAVLNQICCKGLSSVATEPADGTEIARQGPSGDGGQGPASPNSHQALPPSSVAPAAAVGRGQHADS